MLYTYKSREFLTFYDKQKKMYEKEVREILEGKLHPIQVDEEIIPFINLKENVPESYLFSPQNVKVFEHFLRKFEFFFIFKNLFSLNLKEFVVIGGSETLAEAAVHRLLLLLMNSNNNRYTDFSDLFTGLQFTETYLTTPLWKFHHKILFFLLFFPIAFLWIVLRNLVLAMLIRILSCLYQYFSQFCHHCLYSEPWMYPDFCVLMLIKLMFVLYCYILFLTPLVVFYWIVYIHYTILMTGFEISSWGFAIFFSIDFGGLIKPQKFDHIQIMKEKLCLQEKQFSDETIIDVHGGFSV